MAGAQRYKDLDWSRPLGYVLNLVPPTSFLQSVMARGFNFTGSDIVPAPPATGISWEFTGQTVETCKYLYAMLNLPQFQSCFETFGPQILQAQNQAPFGDGMGIPSSTLQNGDSLPPLNECLISPFQCFPERVGLAATDWGIYSDQGFNPLAYAGVGLTPNTLTFPAQPVGTPSASTTVTMASTATAPVAISSIAFTGANTVDFSEQDDCLKSSPLAAGTGCTIAVTFNPGASGTRNASLQISDNALGSPQTVILSGTGVSPIDFLLSVAPASQQAVAGNSARYTLNASGNAPSIALSGTAAPAGPTLTFSPNPIAPGGSSTLTVSTNLSTLPGLYQLAITAAGPSSSHQATATLTIAGPTSLAPASLTFPSQVIGATSPPQTVTLTNTSSADVHFTGPGIALSTGFYGDFTQTNTCGASLAPGSSCIITVAFSPTGSGARGSALLVIDDASNSPGTVTLTGEGVGSCSTISNCAYQVLTQRSLASQNAFFIYQDADSGLNHGFPIVFPDPAPGGVGIVSCVDDPASTTGCDTLSTAEDGTRGTVLQIVLPSLIQGQFVGVYFVDPQNYAPNTNPGNGYNLTGATTIQFDVRSPNSATVQFGAGGCVTGNYAIGQTWTHINIPLNSLVAPTGVYPPPQCPPDITDINRLFVVQSSAPLLSQGQATVLLDNIQFTPAPARQSSHSLALSLPVSDQTFGVVPQLLFPIPPDQVDRNVSTLYESALTLIALLAGGQSTSVAPALEIADALDYALTHDNHGDPIPSAPGSQSGCYLGVPATQCGLHSAYINGDIGFLNNQPSPEKGQAGDVRLAGFSSGIDLCGPSLFCLVLDGATGGDNSWGMLALLAAYRESGNVTYLNDAVAIGNWIVANLMDKSGDGYGGYFQGYNDGGLPKQLILGKSTVDNADIFSAFNLLSAVESSMGNSAVAAQWAANANIAGDFVIRMFDTEDGRFYAGTVNSASAGTMSPGLCPNLSLQAGNDVINTCDSLDSDVFTIVAMAAAPRYHGQIDWRQPMQYAINHFVENITVENKGFSGFDLVAKPTVGPNGVAWEYTGQAIVAMQMLDQLYGVTTLQANAASFKSQIQLAQTSAPFGDGLGLVASTIQSGDALPPAQQCLATPFACLPERVALGATAWAIFTDLNVNPMFYLSALYSYTVSGKVTFTGSALSGVTVALSGSQNGSTTTNDAGSYSFTVAAGGSYTVTPLLSGYGFVLSSQTFTNVSANAVANFTAVPAPTVNVGGIVNAANYSAPVAPGSIAAAFGDFLLTASSVDTQAPLLNSLLGLSLEVGTVAQAPLFFVSGAQLNLQVPWEMSGQSQTTVVATLNGQTGPSQTMSIAPFAPAIFTTNSEGTGQGAITDTSNRLVSSSNPATAGSTYVQIFCTGLGSVTNQPATGSPALSSPLSRTTTVPTVTIGGAASIPQFAGLAPGFVGLYQVNAQVPPDSAKGGAVPVMISIGGATSNVVTIAVE